VSKAHELLHLPRSIGMPINAFHSFHLLAKIKT